jgi:hypothetical protein
MADPWAWGWRTKYRVSLGKKVKQSEKWMLSSKLDNDEVTDHGGCARRGKKSRSGAASAHTANDKVWEFLPFEEIRESSLWLSLCPFLTSFTVPIYNGHARKGRKGFRFKKEDFDSLTDLPFYTDKKKKKKETVPISPLVPLFAWATW